MYRGDEICVADQWVMEICRFRGGRTADPKNGGSRYPIKKGNFG